jgi:hypothetical protein
MLTASENAVVAEGLRGYPAIPKYRDPFKVWLEKSVSTRTLPNDAYVCANPGKKREIATEFAGHGADVASTIAAGRVGATGIVAGATSTLALAFTGIGIVVTVLGFIFSRHKAKVAQERAVLCDAIPGAQEVLKQVDLKVQTGAWTGSDAAAALDYFDREFNRQLAAILKDDANKCNAACGYRRALRANVQIRLRVDYPAADVRSATLIIMRPTTQYAVKPAGSVLAGRSPLVDVGIAAGLAWLIFS